MSYYRQQDIFLFDICVRVCTVHRMSALCAVFSPTRVLCAVISLCSLLVPSPALLTGVTDFIALAYSVTDMTASLSIQFY